jgi:hypothetical protein
MGGFRELDDARDVLSDAIDWWEAQLEIIERAAGMRQPSRDGLR